MRPALAWCIFLLWIPAAYVGGLVWGDPACCGREPSWLGDWFGVMFWGILLVAFGLASWTLAVHWRKGEERAWWDWTAECIGLLALVTVQPFVAFAMRWILWPPGN